MGYTPASGQLLREAIAPETRIRLWNVLHLSYWGASSSRELAYSDLNALVLRIWHHFFAWRIDEQPEYLDRAVAAIDSQFIQFKWHKLFDFMEFVANNGPEDRAGRFRQLVNTVLSEDNSAYRFVGSEMAEITSSTEIASIEDALATASSNRLTGVTTHLSTALHLLSDKTTPDYRNSIKESVSAVEGIAQLFVGDTKATLGAALSVLEKRGHLHGALKSSLSSLYGYTSDADGIRHAMLEEPTLTFTDAKFMLVACSAFVNFMIAKAADLGVSLNQPT